MKPSPDKRSFKLNSPSVIGAAIEFINQVDPSDNLVMTVAPAKNERSSAQHRLKWLWMQQIARELQGKGKGWGAEAWNDYFKGRYMHDLLISQDGDWKFYFDGCNAQYRKGIDKLEFYRLVGKALETADLTVQNMSEFMDRIDKACQSKGLILVTPQDLTWIKAK